MKINIKNFLSLILFFLIFSVSLFCQDLHHNPWDLIIYRPENSKQINDIRCYLKLEDEKGNDVTKTAIRSASYEWISIPGVANNYKRSYYLSGGMAMHLNIKPGKYKISFYTPKEKHEWPEYEYDNNDTWYSNIFEYDTDNPLKVLFIYPTTNDNGFYNGGWILDYRSPKYFKFTVPKMIYSE